MPRSGVAQPTWEVPAREVATVDPCPPPGTPAPAHDSVPGLPWVPHSATHSKAKCVQSGRWVEDVSS